MYICTEFRLLALRSHVTPWIEGSTQLVREKVCIKSKRLWGCKVYYIQMGACELREGEYVGSQSIFKGLNWYGGADVRGECTPVSDGTGEKRKFVVVTFWTQFPKIWNIWIWCAACVSCWNLDVGGNWDSDLEMYNFVEDWQSRLFSSLGKGWPCQFCLKFRVAGFPGIVIKHPPCRSFLNFVNFINFGFSVGIPNCGGIF